MASASCGQIFLCSPVYDRIIWNTRYLDDICTCHYWDFDIFCHCLCIWDIYRYLSNIWMRNYRKFDSSLHILVSHCREDLEIYTIICAPYGFFRYQDLIISCHCSKYFEICVAIPATNEYSLQWFVVFCHFKEYCGILIVNWIIYGCMSIQGFTFAPCRYWSILESTNIGSLFFFINAGNVLEFVPLFARCVDVPL